MPSTYSPNLRLELIASGEQANTWGITTNTNLGTLLEDAIAGYEEISVTAADVVLTHIDGAPDQSRNMILAITGSPTSARSVYCPDNVTKIYVVANDTSQILTISTVSGFGVDISAGQAQLVYCDGINVYSGTTSSFVADRALQSDALGNIEASAVTATELSYLSGVTSAIQTQLDAKQATITGGASTIVSSNLTASRALASDVSGKVAVSAVTSTELGYVSGVTSAIQTQLNAKQATITGAASTIASSDLSASLALVSNASGKVAASAITATELGYLSGVTSNIQTQLGTKQANITGAASTITSTDLSASLALVSNASGKVAVSSVTSTELGYVSGVTSAIQTQLNAKQAAVTGAATTITSADLTASRAVVSNASGKVAVSAVTSTELGYVSGATSNIQDQINAIVSGTGPIPSGTKMLFMQAAAPTGWTLDTTHNNKALRIVNTTGGTYGGSVGFTTAFASQTPAGTVGSTTLSTAQIPAHTHTFTTLGMSSQHTHQVTMSAGTIGGGGLIAGGFYTNECVVTRGSTTTGGASADHTHDGTTNSTGSSSSHDHSFTGSAMNLAVQYVDAIICTKN